MSDLPKGFENFIYIPNASKGSDRKIEDAYTIDLLHCTICKNEKVACVCMDDDLEDLVEENHETHFDVSHLSHNQE